MTATVVTTLAQLPARQVAGIAAYAERRLAATPADAYYQRMATLAREELARRTK
jgi:hypothetical protein